MNINLYYYFSLNTFTQRCNNTNFIVTQCKSSINITTTSLNFRLCD